MAWRPNIRDWGPYDGWAGWLRGLVITVAAASFLAFAGAFGVRASPPARFAYWLGLMLGGWLWGTFVSRAFFPNRPMPVRRVWLRAGLAALTIAAPYTAVVGLVTHRISGTRFTTPAAVAELFGTVLAITLIMVFVNTLVERQAEVFTQAAPQGGAPSKFLDRLPAKLKGAELWAVEAQDHYLRLHTSLGQDLILMRLSDAIVELQGIEGAQTHRSWWVARAAIAQAERGDGRATLTLPDGAEAPVSRTHARRLRELGWI
ncbi:MAG: LytTR family transcriptional regulator DNA-binding domain-containing protein [Proteobacteria bacterium]|nr:LytTR family transcriptional regulator DNA-binding domain-containing protein [Pseudomonadota bacterium]